MPTYLEIAVNIPQISGIFHYHLPGELEGLVYPGSLVVVPFGSQTVQGVVIRQVIEPAVAETRPVIELVDPETIVTSQQLKLAEWMSKATLSPLSACISLMVPAGLSQKADVLYSLRLQASDFDRSELTHLPKRLINLLEKRGPLRGSQIDAAIPRLEWRSTARNLVKRGVLNARSVLPSPKVQPKFVRTARLACPLAEAEKALPTLANPSRLVRLAIDPEQAESREIELGRSGTQAFTRRQKILHLLIGSANKDNPWLDVSDVYSNTGSTGTDLDRLIKIGLVSSTEGISPALERRQAMLRYLMREPGEVEVSWLYAESGGNLSDLYQLEERGLVMLGESEVFRDPLEDIPFVLSNPPELTGDQALAWGKIVDIIHEADKVAQTPTILLHGVTGSGKTEIYLRAVQETLDAGRQAIVLVPEIALTPQTVRRFINRFPGQVGLIHSALSQGERYDTWRRARMGSLSVIVGPRSALFTPLDNLGLIILDECHDDSYYQGEMHPHYHAREVASAYAQIAGAVCLMGSATPDVVSFAQATGKVKSLDLEGKVRKWLYLSLPNRILAHREAVQSQIDRLGLQGTIISKYHPIEGQAEMIDLPPVQVVDMRDELKAGNRSIFSRKLQARLEDVLNQNQQAILFLNRRGMATYVFCRDCGLTLKCPRCDIPLTFHKQNGQNKADQTDNHKLTPKLLCHYCGYSRVMVGKCPDCGSKHIRQFGTGTERVEAEIKTLFPQARTLRWDWETTRYKGAHEVIMGHFVAHRADLLIGTQMLAKGLDLPFVTLVGVVLADVGLGLPDFSANERTFQVLTQVAGRAGRSPLGGSVVLQTYQPDHYVIQTAAAHDYSGFFQKELDYRRKLGYPPYIQMVKLEFRHTNPDIAEERAHEMAKNVLQWIQAEDRRLTRLTGPFPPFFARQGGYYRWQMILRGPNPVSLINKEVRLKSLIDWHIEVNPPSLL